VKVFNYAMRRGFTAPVSLILNCLLPVVLMIVANDYSFMMVNQYGDADAGGGFFTLMLLLMFGAFMMAGSIQADKRDGTTVRILAGPITFRSYLVQNFFAGLVPMIILSFILGGMGLVMYSWTVEFMLAVVLCYILLSATSIGLSFVWSIWFKDKETAMVSFTFAMMLMGFMGGMLLPLGIMPAMLRNIGAVFPAHWASRGMEELLAYGITAQYWLSMAALVLFSAALILYGSRRRIV